MKLYNYKAKDGRGMILEDILQANDVNEVAGILKSQNLQPLTIKEREKMASGLFGGKIAVSEKSALCRFLSTMLKSGMSVPEAVDIIRSETKNKRLKRVLSDISFQTRKGKSLSFVLSQYPHDFDEIFLTMIKVGEESGTLDKSFRYLSGQLAAAHELNQKVIGSMMYPAVIVVAMVANGLMMTLFVLPRISKVFLRLDLPLPIYTKYLLTVGEFFGSHVLLVILVTIGSFVGIVMLFFIERTRKIMVNILIRMPLVKKVVEYIDIARFSRTLATLLASGVPIIDALDLSANVLTQGAMQKEAKSFGEAVSRGESLSSVLVNKRSVFPAVMVQTVRAGEHSGSLDKILAELADFYESEVDFSLKRLTSLLEPLLMLVVGAVVGVMVIVMIAPIYSIIGGLQSSIQN
ncbi:hypothetical protein A2382_00295 [Candidatus Woesebacteria bacterium RIFOXYB1_FULL_38_16]|uniref:Type II secretion system protein GspF domain-containing protein n=1 Tax=Candidatus Woesebacteria bacterium RIFOXYB1_FULL_38_16 TaxID=1802538 RepID=A0A1F8CSH6_9BACT|nr:MAG: hypothetical protein A2191_01180 [Candidatus Woesebacteria bacterium RIFOXYA1_FULL_38_9]OGM79211.1 MAG: hypothetical protein A2382_00295 [Candidatus Woesebacteria bacterium RIFOXYB1_FULL_38_16]